MLARIVENTVLRHRTRLIGAPDNIFERLVFPLGAGNQFIAIINIGFVMQIVMIFQRFLGHTFIGKRIMGIGKIRKFKSHRRPPFKFTNSPSTNGRVPPARSSPNPIKNNNLGSVQALKEKSARSGGITNRQPLLQ